VILDLKRLLAALAIASLTLTALVIPAVGQHKNEVITLPFSAAPYTVGERLTYNVSLSSFVSAAHIELAVAAHGTFFGRDAVQLRGHVETTGVVYAAVYALNNDYTTYVEATTGLPFRTEQVVREGSRAATALSDLSQPGGSSAIPDRTVGGELAGVYDLLSSIYRLRAVPLTEGTTYPFTVRSEPTSYHAELVVKGRQTVKTNVGSFNTIASQLRVSNNSAINDYRIQIFFTDDDRHVPVLITAKLSAGEVRAELASSQVLPVGLVKQPPGAPTPLPTPVPTPPTIPPTGTGPRLNGALNGMPFKVGEQLNYKVYLASLQQPVGTVSYQVRNRSRYFDHDGLMLTISAQTTDGAQRLFVANDQLTSYVDPETLLPYRSELSLAEGRRHSNEIWTINQDYGTAAKQGGGKVDIPIGTHDYLSIFYAMRSMNLAPPKRNAVSILINGRPRTLIVTALRREMLQLDSQKIPAIQVSLTTTPEDPQPDKFQLRAWISDDDRRLPLRFTAMTELGGLRADLVILPVTYQ
jgi:Protein of unknown function (DUF3108)